MSSESKTIPNIIIGSDHAGYYLKDQIVEYLKKQGTQVTDVGCYNTESVDYPKISEELCIRMKDAQNTFGILVCGSGIGVSMAANRFKYIRAVRAHDVVSVRLSRLHNDANVICLGARLIAAPLAFELINEFLSTSFEGDRHKKRVDQMGILDSSC